MLVDVAKRACQVEFESGQSGLQVNRVVGQNESFLNWSFGRSQKILTHFAMSNKDQCLGTYLLGSIRNPRINLVQRK